MFNLRRYVRNLLWEVRILREEILDERDIRKVRSKLLKNPFNYLLPDNFGSPNLFGSSEVLVRTFRKFETISPNVGFSRLNFELVVWTKSLDVLFCFGCTFQMLGLLFIIRTSMNLKISNFEFMELGHSRSPDSCHLKQTLVMENCNTQTSSKIIKSFFD